MSGRNKSIDTGSSSDTSLTRRKTYRINDRFVKSLHSPDKGNSVYFDDRLKGFGVRITANANVAFFLNYVFKGRERRITIGQYPTWTVLAARKQSEELKVRITKGIDPLEQKQSEHAAPTVRDLWERYERDYLPKLAKRSQQDQKSMFVKSILPKLGAKKVSDVTFTDCERLHQHLTKDRPIRANRVIEVLRRNFNLAIKWGWIEKNPAVGIERNPESKRERYLSQEEIARLLDALDKHNQRASCDAIKFMLFTGCRRGEALNARWDQFDTALQIWTKPAATTKQKRLHRVPVAAAVTALLKHRQTSRHSDFIFPSTSGSPLKDVKKTWSSVKRAAGITDTRLHDLRHTFASIAVSNGQSLPIIGAMLGHTQTQTTARYAHLYDTTLFEAAESISKSLQRQS